MRKPDEEPALLQSGLVDRPDIAQAIGMVNIELSNMEFHFAQLLSQITGLNFNIALAVYFTPKANIARLEVIQNVAALVFKPEDKKLSEIEGFLRKAKSVMGRRHELIHSSWVGGQSEVYAWNPPRDGIADMLSKPKKVGEITNLVHDIRVTSTRLVMFLYPPGAKPVRFNEASYRKMEIGINQWEDPTGLQIAGRAGQSLADILDELERDGVFDASPSPRDDEHR